MRMRSSSSRSSHFKAILLAFALCAVSWPGAAHSPASGPHGGQVADVQGHHIEFTATETGIVLFLTGKDNEPIDSKDASGRVTILDGGKQFAADLAPAGANRLAAPLTAPLKPGAKVVVSARLGDGHNLQARFAVK